MHMKDASHDVLRLAEGIVRKLVADSAFVDRLGGLLAEKSRTIVREEVAAALVERGASNAGGGR